MIRLTVGFYSQVLQNGFLQIDFLFFPIALVTFCYFLYHLYSNLLLTFSAKVFAFQWKNLILHTFYFNWKVAAATATTSFYHERLRGANASTELL